MDLSTISINYSLHFTVLIKTYIDFLFSQSSVLFVGNEVIIMLRFNKATVN